MISLQPKISQAPPQGARAKTTVGLSELVILAVIGILLYIFIIAPKRGEYAQAKNSLQTLQSAHTQAQEEAAKLDALVQDMKSKPGEIAKLDEALPLNGRITRLRLNLEYITKSSGMSVSDVSVTAPGGDQIIAGDLAKLANPYAAQRKVQKYSCTLSVNGTADQFEALLKKLEDSGRILDMQSISVASSKDNFLQFNISLVAYAYE